MLNTSKLLLLFISAIATSSYGATAVSGPNCDTAEPPADAGYYVLMGVPMRVHPAPELINATYAGCQSLWSFEESEPKLEMKILFRKGNPTFLIGATLNDPSYPLKCNVNLEAGPRAFDCEPIGRLPFPSMPKDCLKFQATPPDSRGFYIDRACRQVKE